MEEDTFDEFSELVTGNAGGFLPPSASHTVVSAAQRAAQASDDENLSNGFDEVGSDDGVDEPQGGQTEAVEAEADDEADNEEAQARLGATSSDAAAARDANDDADAIVMDDDYDDHNDGDDGATEDSSPNTSPRHVRGDDDETPAARTERVAPRAQSAPLPFAVSRIKALFKFAHASGRAASGNGDDAPLCVLSTEAASVLSEAAGLMLADLVTAAVGETQRKDKKTLSYEDVAYMVAQLDRFSFLSDVVPSAGPGLKSGGGKLRQGAASTTTAHPAPAAAAKPKATRTRRTTAAHPPPTEVHGPKRQLTLNFGSAARPAVHQHRMD